MKSSENAIKFIALKQGTHTYSYHIGKTFFDQYEYPEPIVGEFDVKVTLTKTSTMMSLYFEFEGNMKLDCDLCLEELNVPIKYDAKAVINLGMETNAFDEEVRVFGTEVYKIELVPYFYEYIQLAKPTRVVHDDVKDCNQDILDKLDDILTDDAGDQEIDPRWDKLKKL